MGRVALAVVALGASGCAQIFGLAQTTGAAPDATTSTPVSLAFQRYSIGASIVIAPQDLTGQTATYLVADPTDPSGLREVPATLAATRDGWTADIATGTPAVEFTMPDLTPFRRMYAFPQRTVLGLYGVYEHPNPSPAPTGAAFALTATLPSGYVGSELFQIYAVGPWAYHNLVAAELPAPNVGATTISTTIGYNATTFGSINGRPPSQVTTADQLVVLRYVGNNLTASAQVPPFDQAGATAAVSVALAATPQTALDVHVQPAAVGPRLGATLPTMSALAMNWSVNAAPGYLVANGTGPVLQAGGVLATDSGAITAGYGNPFLNVGWHSAFTWATSESRTYTVPSKGLPVTLYTGLNEIAEVSAGLTLDLPTGLPQIIHLNQMPLSSDGMTIVLDPAKSVELDLVPDRTTNTFYQWNVYELGPNPTATALQYNIAFAALAVVPNVTIPNDVFVAGHVYTIRGHCVTGGYPKFGEGNLQSRGLPYAVGYLDSGVFTVAGP